MRICHKPPCRKSLHHFRHNIGNSVNPSSQPQDSKYAQDSPKLYCQSISTAKTNKSRIKTVKSQTRKCLSRQMLYYGDGYLFDPENNKSQCNQTQHIQTNTTYIKHIIKIFPTIKMKFLRVSQCKIDLICTEKNGKPLRGQLFLFSSMSLVPSINKIYDKNIEDVIAFTMSL